MCTAIAFKQKHSFFGRTLDLEYHYDEEVVITPREYHFLSTSTDGFKTDFAIIGIATVKSGYPLYYDAVNEHGICMAGLNFVGNAKFSDSEESGTVNLAQYELIPFILGKAKTLYEAESILKEVRLINTPFDKSTPTSELHYFLSDGEHTLVAEPGERGMKLYDNPFGVLTNNPPFPYHMENIKNYMRLTKEVSENCFDPKLPLVPYSRGLGAFGLPGDLSSASRFVRAAFGVANAEKKSDDEAAVGQVFHILGSVSQTEGLVNVDGAYEKTQYSICANLNTHTYYYKTYGNSRITAVRLGREERSKSSLSRYPLRYDEDILFENG